jgi:hypothetical protein
MSAVATGVACVGVGVIGASAAAQDPTPAYRGLAAYAKEPSSSPLSHRLQLLADPAVSRAPAAARARALSLPEHGPASLEQVGDRVVVHIQFDRLRPGSSAAVKGAGGEVMLASHSLEAITAAVAPADLERVARVDGVTSVIEEVEPMTASHGRSAVSASTGRPPGCPAGSKVSEGDSLLKADQARTSFGVDGSGIKIGAMSDSYDLSTSAVTHAAGDVSSGDLPGTTNPCGFGTPVQVLNDDSPASRTDEGRAQAQILHDLAPAAPLAFHEANTNIDLMAAAIDALRDAGTKVEVDDVTFFREPMFQDGPISVAVSDVVHNSNVPYFSSAGNNNVIDGSGRNVGSYEAPAYRNTSCPTGIPGGCMDFKPGAATDTTFGLTVPPGKTLRLILQWAQPWFGVTTDLDALLAVDNTVVAGGVDNNLSTQQPFELVTWTNNTGVTKNAELLINRFTDGGGDNGTPRLKFILAGNGTQSIVPNENGIITGGDTFGPTIMGHNGSADAITVGAVQYNIPNQVQPASSRGPVTLYFGPVDGTTPAPPLRAPQTIAKPDVSATDCGANTFFGVNDAGTWRFCGTSASAPHAAAIAGLMLDGDSTATFDQIYKGERNTAVPVGTEPPEAQGKGLLDAKAAVAFRLPEISIRDASVTEGDSGSTVLKTTVRLSKPSTDETTIKYSTGGGSATAGTDYESRTNKTLTIPADTTKRKVKITVFGDNTPEPNETFNITLSRPSGLKIADGTGVETILNDD